jgi:hypothetical protein
MSVELTFGGKCRDISKLPQSPADLKKFFDMKIAPAIWEDFSKNVVMASGAGARGIDFDIQDKDCEVGGSVTIKF